MKKNTKQKINHVIDRVNFKLNYLIANTIMKKKIDSGNEYYRIMDDIELVDKIVNQKMSFCRFGDGELSLILEEKFDLNFQYNSPELRKKLYEVLHADLDNLIIGLSQGFNNPSIYNAKAEKGYRTFNYLYREKLKAIVPQNTIYGNASITRFYIDYTDEERLKAPDRINNLRRIWRNRKLLIVEGMHSRLGVGNNLFRESLQIRRILVPETNAFDQYSKILNAIIENAQKDELILLAVGPTATILAHDLAIKKYQAVDVGHIDIEYEWMKMGVSDRVPIKGKYVNEIKGKKYIDDGSQDSEYKNSIIEVVGEGATRL